MQEIWKDIEGYEGRYQISNLGNVKTLLHKTPRLLIAKKNNRGYLWVELRDNGGTKQFLIHRLVATAFIENPHNYPIINHKDENPANNSIDNLEWCDNSYNVLYSMTRHPIRKSRRKITRLERIAQFDLNGCFIREWGTSREVTHEKNYNQTSILECCEGKRHTAYGFRWQFAI